MGDAADDDIDRGMNEIEALEAHRVGRCLPYCPFCLDDLFGENSVGPAPEPNADEEK